VARAPHIRALHTWQRSRVDGTSPPLFTGRRSRWAKPPLQSLRPVLWYFCRFRFGFVGFPTVFLFFFLLLKTPAAHRPTSSCHTRPVSYHTRQSKPRRIFAAKQPLMRSFTILRSFFFLRVLPTVFFQVCSRRLWHVFVLLPTYPSEAILVVWRWCCFGVLCVSWVACYSLAFRWLSLAWTRIRLGYPAGLFLGDAPTRARRFKCDTAVRIVALVRPTRLAKRQVTECSQDFRRCSWVGSIPKARLSGWCVLLRVSQRISRLMCVWGLLRAA